MELLLSYGTLRHTAWTNGDKLDGGSMSNT